MKKMNRTKLCAAVLAACIAATAVPAAAVYAAGSGSTTESTAQAGKSDKERRSPADEWVKEGIISEKTGENVKAWLKENRTKKTADGTETQTAEKTTDGTKKQRPEKKTTDGTETQAAEKNTDGTKKQRPEKNADGTKKQRPEKKTTDGTETQAADGTGTKTGKGGRRGAGISSETLDELVKAGILTQNEAAKILEREDSRKEKKEAGGSAV